MKQLLQNLKNGVTELAEIPCPQVSRGGVLIRTTRTLVSKGTERMLVEFGNANLIQKARQQPDKVKMVIDKIRSDGLMPTLETVFNKLDQPLPLGYCNVGRVIAVGPEVTQFLVGDRVASNGPHAEIVCVPKNLCARIPDSVSDDAAAFTVIGSIGLQGIRLLQPTFGEAVVVVGLGLIGLISSQILRANGCRVIGFDYDQSKVDLANRLGIVAVNPAGGTDQVKFVEEQTQGIGSDAVLITASAKNNEIISQAARMSRKRGRIILVGVIGLNISRAEFYEKELTFQVSCSYGPGRYDEDYEQKGQDYPIGFVRWTEKRNFEAVLQAISSGSLKVQELISEVVELKDYQKIYGEIGSSKAVASILKYPEKSITVESAQNTILLKDRSFQATKAVVGVIGAGNFTRMTMLPALKDSGAGFKYIASSGGVTCTALAKKFGFTHSTTDYHQILHDPDVDTVFITTRHNSHAKFVVDALKAGKHVFVEKPLALNNDQLNQIIDAYQAPVTSRQPTLTVGFNRRFSPHIQAIKKSLGSQPGPINIIATMNAGHIPPNVWVHDLQIGGGRIIGEACHYLDLCVYLAGSEIQSVCINALGENPHESTDNASILVRFKNGSNAAINYFANGAKSYSKERVEVFSRERVWIMDNFRTTTGYGAKGFKGLKTRIDKGHTTQFQTYIQRIQTGGEPLIPISEIINVARASFAAIESLKTRSWIEI